MLHIFYKQNFNKQHQAEIWLEKKASSAYSSFYKHPLQGLPSFYKKILRPPFLFYDFSNLNLV